MTGVLTDGWQKYGRPNEATPAKWQKEYTDFHAPLEVNGQPSAPQVTAGAPVKQIEPPKEVVETKPEPNLAKTEEVNDRPAKESKKRKDRGEEAKEETKEERAERKRRKREKKEKRKSKGEKGGEDSD